jgi:outer membrane lipoprotein SlyB
MKFIAPAVLALSVMAVGAAPAEAKGCLKGAAVGGVGGHFVGKGHAVAGAAIGCAVGHHRAKVAARKQAAAAKAQQRQ